MKVIRRALATVAVSGTALAGVMVAATPAAQASTRPAATTLSIRAPHAVTYDMTVTVKGKLRLTTHHHMAVQGATVMLMERTRPRAKWTPDGTGTTGTTGKVLVTSINPVKRTTEFRLDYGGTSTTRKSHSAVKTVKVRYAVTATPGTGIVTVTVTPGAKRARVLLQKKNRRGWRTIAHAKLDRTNGTTATFKVTKAGTYRVVKPSGHRLLRGHSAPFTVS